MASVVKKKNGLMMRWTVSDPVTGELSKRSRMFGGEGGRRAALAEANRIEAAERQAPVSSEGRRTSLRAFVESRWLPFHKTHVSAATYDTNRKRIAAVLAKIGDVSLASVSGETIDTMLTELAEDGVSPAMRRKAFNVLRTALRQAAKWKRIAGMPWADATPPSEPAPRIRVARLDESARLVDAFRQAKKPVAAAYVETLASSGARPGELLALMWDSVDLEAGTVTIWRAQERWHGGKYRLKDVPKNSESRRVLKLPAYNVETLRALKAWHAELHLASGGVWPKDGFVFAHAKGGMWTVDNATKSILRMAKRIGVTSGAYSRRHGMATEMLTGNVPVKVVSGRLGHASAKMTLDVYAHLLPDADAVAIDFLERSSR